MPVPSAMRHDILDVAHSVSIGMRNQADDSGRLK